MQGRVIGVNTAIFTNTGTSAGVGFAIPIDIVRSVVPQLIQYGKVVRPALNIQVPLCVCRMGKLDAVGMDSSDLLYSIHIRHQQGAVSLSHDSTTCFVC